MQVLISAYRAVWTVLGDLISGVRPTPILQGLTMGLLLVFLTSLDKQLIVVRWLPIHGIVALCSAAALLIGVWLALEQRGLHILNSRVIAALKAHPATFATLMLLSLISVVYGIILSDVSARDTLFISSPFVALCSAVVLGSAIGDGIRIRQLLGIAFAIVVLSIIVDVIAPGTFSVLESRAAGWSINPNRGAFLVLFLATTLLNYDRLDLRSLVVLGVTAEAIFLTLSRGGGLVYVVFAAGYVTFHLISAPLPERIKILVSTGLLGALFIALSALMVLTLPYFDQPGTKTRFGLLTGQISVPGPSTGDSSPNQPIGGLSTAQSGDSDEPSQISPTTQTDAFVSTEQPGNSDRSRQNGPPSPAGPGVSTGQPGGSAASRRATPATETSASISTRLQAWIDEQTADLQGVRVLRGTSAFEIVWSSPIIGNGNRSDARNELSSHNMYLSVWIDFGILGILAYLAFLVGSTARFWRSKCYAGVSLILVTAAWSFFSHNIFDTRPLFLLLGLVIAHAAMGASSETVREQERS